VRLVCGRIRLLVSRCEAANSRNPLNPKPLVIRQAKCTVLPWRVAVKRDTRGAGYAASGTPGVLVAAAVGTAVAVASGVVVPVAAGVLVAAAWSWYATDACTADTWLVQTAINIRIAVATRTPTENKVERLMPVVSFPLAWLALAERAPIGTDCRCPSPKLPHGDGKL
jgi:hypothetical protein